jgi:hypothetical protein
MQTVTTIGLDIAKSVFQVNGVDAQGNVVVRRQLKRRQVVARRSNGIKSRRSITISSQSVIATASAVCGWPSSKALSPNACPGLMVLSNPSKREQYN